MGREGLELEQVEVQCISPPVEEVGGIGKGAEKEGEMARRRREAREGGNRADLCHFSHFSNSERQVQGSSSCLGWS